MFDFDTFVIALYVLADEFLDEESLASESDATPRLGRIPSLCPTEVLTLSLVAQFYRFRSERDFYRFATRRLTHLFPRLPDRSQFNRLQQAHYDKISRFACYLANNKLSCAQDTPFEAMDRLGVATRWCGRRGVGWLPDCTDKGYCSRLRFFHGFHLLTAVTQEGVITGLGIGPASAKDQSLCEAFLYARAYLAQTPDLAVPLVGRPAGTAHYFADTGFSGPKRHLWWHETYRAAVTCPLASTHVSAQNRAWPASSRRWLASLRQIVETVHHSLLQFCRLERERPHTLTGFWARLGAKMALHNACIFLNRQVGRANLEFADLVQW